MARTQHTFEIDLERHVYPLLHLARVAVSIERMLNEIEATRAMLPDLNERLKRLGLPTCYGQSVADHVDMAILVATDLLEAHQHGSIYVTAPDEGGSA
jgi:hypothetical protein